MKKTRVNTTDNSCRTKSCESSGCTSYDIKNDLMQKVIDGQANDEEKMIFETIIAQCVDCECRQYCTQEIAIRNLLQTKLDRKSVPMDLVEQIKSKIKIG